MAHATCSSSHFKSVNTADADAWFVSQLRTTFGLVFPYTRCASYGPAAGPPAVGRSHKRNAESGVSVPLLHDGAVFFLGTYTCEPSKTIGSMLRNLSVLSLIYFFGYPCMFETVFSSLVFLEDTSSYAPGDVLSCPTVAAIVHLCLSFYCCCFLYECCYFFCCCCCVYYCCCFCC